MVEASSLYIVIIIALVIGLLCSSIIVAAYFYRAQYQAKARYHQLKNNLNSGVNILLASDEPASAAEKTLNLFEGKDDSISMRKIRWGVFDIGIVKAFIQKDTLYKIFSFANSIDSTKWAALYLIDEDRPFSLSGKTTIRGDAYIPKAGVQTAYVDNKSYEDDKRLIIGAKHNSERKLPAINDTRLSQFEHFFGQEAKSDTVLPKKDTVSNSFLNKTHIFNLKKKRKQLKIKGQVYSYGIMQLNDKSEVDGSLFTNRFWYQNTFTRYENYLTNSTINAKGLSPYYLSSNLIPVVKKRKKVLRWLEAN